MSNMICNIDDKNSVLSIVSNLTKNWFNAEDLYEQLKANKITESSAFWHIKESLLSPMAKHIGKSLNDFLTILNDRCSLNGLRIMGYHCTRHIDKSVFLSQGILPLSERSIDIFISSITTEFRIKLTEQHVKNLSEIMIKDDLWRYRSGKGTGPYFLLSYRDAHNPKNAFCNYGPEIWWKFVDIFLQYCSDNEILFTYARDECREIISKNFVPLIMHCAIPYSILPDKDYYIFCIFRAYFDFIDPNDDVIQFEGWSIDLKGRALEPEYIVMIEEL